MELSDDLKKEIEKISLPKSFDPELQIKKEELKEFIEDIMRQTFARYFQMLEQKEQEIKSIQIQEKTQPKVDHFSPLIEQVQTLCHEVSKLITECNQIKEEIIKYMHHAKEFELQIIHEWEKLQEGKKKEKKTIDFSF